MLRISKKTGYQSICSILFTVINLLVIPIAQANKGLVFADAWHGVVSLGGGGAFFSPIGSKTFPIIDPITDQFFIYESNSSYSRGFFDFFAGVEWAFCPPGLMQLGLAYDHIANFHVTGTLTQGADLFSLDNFNYQYHALSRQLLAEGKLLYNYRKLYPYVLVGLGASFNHAKNFETNVPPTLTFTRQYADRHTTSFSYDLGLGIDFDLTTCLRLGVGYRFAYLGRMSLGSATIDTTPVWGTLSQKHTHSNEILAQITLVI